MEENPLYLYEPLYRSKRELEAVKSLPFPQGGSNYVPTYSSWSAWDAAIDGRFEGSNIDYRSKVGDLSKSSLIMSAVRWLGNTLPEAPLEVKDPGDGKGDAQAVADHKLLDVLRKPNDFYAGDSLWTAFAYSWIIDGNVYLIKVWNVARTEVVELWYEPHWNIRPRWINDNQGAYVSGPNDSSQAFINYYEVDRNYQKYRVEVEDVVHFRDGNDPYNPRVGWSYIRSIYREIYGDNEVSNFQSRLFGGSAVPPFMVEIHQEISGFNSETAQAMAADLKRKTTGDRKGDPIVVYGGKPHKLAWSPSELDLKMLHRFSEERFCAVTGIPAVVLSLGVGMDHSIYNNVAQADKRAYEAYLKPLYRRIAAQVNLQLLPDFERDGSKLYTAHDLSKVSAAQEDTDSKSKRTINEFRGGFITFNEARATTGYETVDGGDFVLLPANVSRVNKDEMNQEPAMPTQPVVPTKSVNVPSDDEVRGAIDWLTEVNPELAELVNANGNGHKL